MIILGTSIYRKVKNVSAIFIDYLPEVKKPDYFHPSGRVMQEGRATLIINYVDLNSKDGVQEIRWTGAGSFTQAKKEFDIIVENVRSQTDDEFINKLMNKELLNDS